MNILFTICGRAGSKGIKNKNIRNFLGYPLPYYSLSVMDLFVRKNRNYNTDVVVNTDSKELITIMRENPFGYIDIIKRSDELAGDDVGKVDVIRNCLYEMEYRNEYSYDIVIDLDITSPLRKVEDLDKLIRTHIEKKPDVTTSVTSARRNPFFNQVKREGQGIKKVIETDYISRQQAPTVYDMNASLYAYDSDYLRAGGGVLDGYCEAIEMFDTGVLDLDHNNDFELMEVIADYLYKTYPSFGEVREHIKECIIE